MENRGRTMVQFAFYKFDAAWRRQPEEIREKEKAEFLCAVEEAAVGNRKATAPTLTRRSPAPVISKCAREPTSALIASAAPAAPAKPPALKSP